MSAYVPETGAGSLEFDGAGDLFVVDTFESDLEVGVAALLDANGIGVYSETGPYADSDTGISLGEILPSPDNLITLTSYGVKDDPFLSDSVVGLQVRCRAAGQDRRPSTNMGAAIFSLLQGATGLTLSTGVFVVLCLRQSGMTSLGLDANLRWSNVQNFYLTVHRLSANRT